MAKIRGLMRFVDALVDRYKMDPEDAEKIVKDNKWMNLEGALIDEPAQTRKAYKLFDQKNDQIYPLYVDNKTPIPMNEWMFAKHMPPNDKGEISSGIGSLAYRPGFHSGTNPFALHIGGKSNRALPVDYRKYDQVWGEIEVPRDYDWYNEAMYRARMTNDGRIDPQTAEIKDQLPLGGSYNYNTNANVAGDWLISDRIKVNRLLDRDEVQDINKRAGVSDLPTIDQLIRAGKVDKSKLTKVAKEQLRRKGLLDLIYE